MQSNHRPDRFIDFLPAIIGLILFGAGGLAVILVKTLPTIFPRWLFIFFLVIFVTGFFMPLVYFLNHRFPSKPTANRNIIVRQSLWFGIYAAVIAWLQLGRALTFVLAAILGAALILIEIFLRMWERSRWKPEPL
ncbi:MAG TPA: hypothetical protein PKG95_03930 [Anaerolineaceae bacterium]|nr:hypothetical protein [Anaerolineaceae bacterium]